MFGASSIHFHFYSGMFSFLSVFNNGIMTQQDQDSVFGPRSNLDSLCRESTTLSCSAISQIWVNGADLRSGIFSFSIV